MPKQTAFRRSDQHLIPATRPNRLSQSIKAGKAIKALNDCVAGTRELSSQQVNACRILLNKVLPDAVQPKDENINGIKDVTHVPTWKLIDAAEGEVIEGKTK